MDSFEIFNSILNSFSHCISFADTKNYFLAIDTVTNILITYCLAQPKKTKNDNSIKQKDIAELFFAQ